MADRALLRKLAESEDADVRQEWVEPLRMAAQILTGNAAAWWHIEVTVPEALQGSVQKTAGQLLELAAAFCDHSRITPGGTCRYCEKPLPGWPNV